MSSLHSKISTGYYMSAAVALVFATFAYAGLQFLENRLADGELVADLLQDTLEMRRYEKKYFLSEDPADLRAAIAHAEAGLARLGSGRRLLERLATADERRQVEYHLTRYRDLLQRYEPESRPGRHALSEAVRSAGHLSSQAAKALSRKERDDLTATAQGAQEILVLSFLPLVAVLLIGGRVLSRRVLRPLRDLELRLRPIAEGRYSHMDVPSMDREIVSFARAFNGMLSELQARQEQLRHSERLASLGTLVSGVAHELNNPLGNISSSCQLVQEGLAREDPARLRTWLGQIDDETERARRILRTLLDYSRRQPLRPRHNECVALEEVLSRARSLAGPHPDRPAPVEVDVPTPLILVADEERLQRVFINLFKNAFESGARGVTVTAAATTWAASPAPIGAYTVGRDRLSRADRAQEIIRIRIEDDGPGIPEDLLTRVFEPFFTTRDPGRGTGLGLFIAQEIVQDHDGCISVENRVEGGTRFTLWLPSRCAGRVP